MLDQVGLLSALQWYVDGLTKRSGIEASLEVEPPDFPRLAPELETAIFRIIQEALTNVFRHSGANAAWVNLSQRDGSIMVRIRDNGEGITQQIAELRPGSIGIGLGGLRQRTHDFHGELRLVNLNPGTLVEVVIPHSEGRSVTQRPFSSPLATSSKLGSVGV